MILNIFKIIFVVMIVKMTMLILRIKMIEYVIIHVNIISLMKYLNVQKIVTLLIFYKLNNKILEIEIIVFKIVLLRMKLNITIPINNLSHVNLIVDIV